MSIFFGQDQDLFSWFFYHCRWIPRIKSPDFLLATTAQTQNVPQADCRYAVEGATSDDLGTRSSKNNANVNDVAGNVLVVKHVWGRQNDLMDCEKANMPWISAESIRTATIRL